MAPGDYIRAVAVPNFRSAWEALGEEAELADDYGLGERENLQVLPRALRFQPYLEDITCEGLLDFRQGASGHCHFHV